MVICVYGAASARIDDKFKDEVYKLCVSLGKGGHSLIYGSGSTGVMGAAAEGFKKAGAKVHGVIPKFFEQEGYEGIFYDADEITFTETMAERKKLMEDGCDAFIIAPGGSGTFEEFFEALTLKQLGRHKKAIVVFNIDNYYDKLIEFIESSVEKKFADTECLKLFTVLDKKEDIIEYLENYSTDDIVWNRLKK